MAIPLVGSLDWKSVLIGAVFVWFVLPFILSKFGSHSAPSKNTSSSGGVGSPSGL